MIHVIQFVNHTRFVVFHADDTDMPNCCANLANGFIADISNYQQFSPVLI